MVTLMEGVGLKLLQIVAETHCVAMNLSEAIKGLFVCWNAGRKSSFFCELCGFMGFFTLSYLFDKKKMSEKLSQFSFLSCDSPLKNERKRQKN